MADNLIGPKQQILDCDVLFNGVGHSVECPFPESGQVKNCFTECFARDSAGIDANSAKHRFPLDECYALVEFGGLNRCPLAGRPRTDYDQVVIELRHEAYGSELVVMTCQLAVYQVQTFVNRVKREFQPIGYSELVEDVVQMVLDRLLADEHLLRHFPVLIALRHQPDDFALALAQRRPLPALCRAPPISSVG